MLGVGPGGDRSQDGLGEVVVEPQFGVDAVERDRERFQDRRPGGGAVRGGGQGPVDAELGIAVPLRPALLAGLMACRDGAEHLAVRAADRLGVGEQRQRPAVRGDDELLRVADVLAAEGAAQREVGRGDGPPVGIHDPEPARPRLGRQVRVGVGVGVQDLPHGPVEPHQPAALVAGGDRGVEAV